MDDDPTVDVAVIGSGVAGLHAAHHLHAHGLTVVVLEARDRVGGRLLSPQVDGAGLDLGATWFWPSERRITRLIAELGVATHPQYTAGDALLQLPSGVQRIEGNPMDVSSGRFVSGAQGLAEAMAARLPTGTIELDHAVTSIEVQGPRLMVRTQHGAHAARHVIVAIPPALAACAITIAPALPARLARLAGQTPVWMGAITKVVAHYPEPFWRDAGLAGAAISHVGPIREFHDMSGPDGKPAALFGFAPPLTVGAATITEDQVREQLGALFGPAAATPTRLWIHDWRQEPFTSPAQVERLNDYGSFGHPDYATPALHGRLHWASTETAADTPGHIEGALAAAQRAATAVMRATA